MTTPLTVLAILAAIAVALGFVAWAVSSLLRKRSLPVTGPATGPGWTGNPDKAEQLIRRYFRWQQAHPLFEICAPWQTGGRGWTVTPAEGAARGVPIFNFPTFEKLLGVLEKTDGTALPRSLIDPARAETRRCPTPSSPSPNGG